MTRWRTARERSGKTLWERLDAQLSQCDMLSRSSPGFAEATKLSKGEGTRQPRPR
jgi:hypothetical protein